MAPKQPARIFAVGVNHKSGSAFLRDRLFIDEDMQPGIYARMKDQGVAQAVILSTCDRVEFQGASREPEQAVDILRGLLNEFGGGATQTLDRSIYTYVDEAAVRHDSRLIVLDSQIMESRSPASSRRRRVLPVWSDGSWVSSSGGHGAAKGPLETTIGEPVSIARRGPNRARHSWRFERCRCAGDRP